MPLLVWCMGVSYYKYTLEMLESILQIINDLVNIDYIDILTHFDNIDAYSLWKESNTLVKCILIRGFYRGMAGDIKMLQDYAYMWHNRLKNEQWEKIINNLYTNRKWILFRRHLAWRNWFSLFKYVRRTFSKSATCKKFIKAYARQF